MSRLANKKSVIIWSMPFVFILGALLVLANAEDYIEKELKGAIDDSYPNLCESIELSLISRIIELELVDTAALQVLPFQIVVQEGSIQITGISWRKLFFQGKLNANRISSSMGFASVQTLHDDVLNERIDSLTSNIALSANEVSLDSDSLWIEKGQKFSTNKAVVRLIDLYSSDSISFILSSIDVCNAGTVDAKDRKWTVDQFRMLEDSMVLTKLRVEDKEPSSAKRLYINGSVERLVALGSTKELFQETPVFDSLMVEDFSFQLDELGQRKRCDGQVPCIKKHMSQVLLDLPVKQHISANGGLAYRYYKGDRIESEFAVDNVDLAINYDASADPVESADRLYFHVNALFNGAIPVAWSGNFDRGENFEYTILTESFAMQELNPLLPKFEGYNIAIASGNCDRLKMTVSGRHTQSTSRMWISYDNFKLDIKKDESLGTRLLDWASRTFVNNNHDSDEAFIREMNYDKKYGFFYQMGDHLNNSCQAIMIEDWAQRFL